MEKVLENLFCNHIVNNIHSASITNHESEIEMNKKHLKQNLSKNQKKLLLRIEDGKNLINEISSTESFVEGFKLGLKIGYEVNKE